MCAVMNMPMHPVCSIWQFTYEFNEMSGPRANIEKNPCFGPFPYRYTWNVYIWQKVNFVPPARMDIIERSYMISDELFKISQVNNVNGTRRTSGNIRVCWTDWMDCQIEARGWTIIESERELLDSQCRFQPYDEHPNDWFRYPGYLQGGWQ